MSTSLRRTHAQAVTELDDFRALIRPDLYAERWEVAGSIRRQSPEVGDCDIVAIPKFGDMPVEGDLFGATTRQNLLWARVDDLVKLGTFAKHVKDTEAGPRTKWGDKTRAIEFRGTAYEITICDEANWFLWLAIRTGPGVLSKELVTRLPQRGYTFTGDHNFHLETRDGMSAPKPVIPASEQEVFQLAGISYKPPHQR
jgi:hypothetical protein